uniref:Ig-like domain-containing protein n=1 Tax=Neovison vison TaxID=452646 RepID=A0A8C7EK72_NEOVI
RHGGGGRNLSGAHGKRFSTVRSSHTKLVVGLGVHGAEAASVGRSRNMELRWFRSKFSEAVFIYQNQREQREEQLAQYRGRTSLVKDFLTQGDAAVLIHNVQAFDNGLYTCFFRMGIFYEEANVELKVAGVGSAPQVHITGPEEDGVRVVCIASGWFPKPQVQWRALSGEKFLTFSETQAQDSEGLFTIETTLVVRDSSSGNVTCSVLNPILGQEKAMTIFIPEKMNTQHFFLTPMSVSTEQFMVLGPSEPIVAVLGADITLPCHVSPARDVENMELRWFRSKFSEAVFIYQNQREQREEQLAQYRGRTSLVKDFLTQGEAAVRIHNVQTFDNGLYTCFFRMGIFYEEASLELMVRLGSYPGREGEKREDGVRVVCMASGWFPKPQVQWRALSGEKFLTFSVTEAQDDEGLFTIEATLVVRDSSSGNVTCLVLNPILGQEKAMAFFIPGQYYFSLLEGWDYLVGGTCVCWAEPF